MKDNTCTYCGREGHRAHRCPQRAHLLPWTVGDWVLSSLIVGLIAGVASYA